MVYHSLKQDGTITQYDIRFGRQVIRKVPASLVEAVEEKQHEHAAAGEK